MLAERNGLCLTEDLDLETRLNNATEGGGQEADIKSKLTSLTTLSPTPSSRGFGACLYTCPPEGPKRLATPIISVAPRDECCNASRQSPCQES